MHTGDAESPTVEAADDVLGISASVAKSSSILQPAAGVPQSVLPRREHVDERAREEVAVAAGPRRH
jgi:hypothetical protein